ncbi:MAG TPA: elongation factor Ts [Candidatus Paceibacterota bacterium]|nr:elongation factor Ts [Candidatus Paceibacterota bacterium]
MAVTAEQVMQLREKTGISVMECKKALTEADGDMDKALAILKERSVAMAGKKSDRELGAGVVSAYVHNSAQVGAMVVLNSETDFVSKNEEFVALARDIAMHISAMQPADKAELMAQQYIKDPSKTIEGLLQEATQKFGERVDIGSFSRFAVK